MKTILIFLFSVMLSFPALSQEKRNNINTYFGYESPQSFSVVNELERDFFVVGFKTNVNGFDPMFKVRAGLIFGDLNFHLVLFGPELRYNLKTSEYDVPMAIETRFYKRNWLVLWGFEYGIPRPNVYASVYYKFILPTKRQK